jgi:alpha-ketoglutarate-dependent taurine dioxygenase
MLGAKAMFYAETTTFGRPVDVVDWCLSAEELGIAVDRITASTESEAFLQDAALLAASLPRDKRRQIQSFARFGNQSGVLLLSGLPVDKVVPPTPLDPCGPTDKPTHRSEANLAMIGSLLGYLVGYAQEKDGRVFHNLVPTEKNAAELSSESSKVELDLHSENAFHPYRPDWVLLTGLRTDIEKKAVTTHASIRDALHLLSARDRAELARKAFVTGIDVAYGNRDAAKGLGPAVRVLQGDPSDPFMCYDWDLMECISARSKSALSRLREALRQVTRSVLVEPGSVLVIDNRRAVHGRSVFKANYDGTDRWLQRTNAVRDLNKSRRDRPCDSRVIRTDFSKYLPIASL